VYFIAIEAVFAGYSRLGILDFTYNSQNRNNRRYRPTCVTGWGTVCMIAPLNLRNLRSMRSVFKGQQSSSHDQHPASPLSSRTRIKSREEKIVAQDYHRTASFGVASQLGS
jgi:hypothetical protein